MWQSWLALFRAGLDYTLLYMMIFRTEWPKNDKSHMNQDRLNYFTLKEHFELDMVTHDMILSRVGSTQFEPKAQRTQVRLAWPAGLLALVIGVQFYYIVNE